jgi:ornithine cyclodeaminase
MKVRILNREEVTRLLPMAECVERMAEALATLAREDAVQPLRSMMWLPDRTGLIGLMPGYLGAPGRWGIKLVTVMPGNHGGPYDSHQGVVMLFDPRYGFPRCILDASAITAIRTAAVSAVATRALARESAGDLAILGSGVQARSHLEAMRCVRPIRRVRVWSRNAEHARSFANREAGRQGLAIEAVSAARAAVEGADLICTVTASAEPVLEGAWIAPGAHVNAAGASFATKRELDTEAVRRARLIVDRRESALNEAGEILIPMREGTLGREVIAGELGEVLLGRVAGRRDPDEITVFKSLGLAIEDVAAAGHVLERAEAEGVGLEVEWS